MTTRSDDAAATSAARTALLALARLLGTVGVLPARSDNLMDNVLATYALPRTSPTPQEGRRVTRLASTLSGRRDIAVPVHLRDTVKVPRLPRVDIRHAGRFRPGRYAIAIDGAPRSVRPAGGSQGQEHRRSLVPPRALRHHRRIGSLLARAAEALPAAGERPRLSLPHRKTE